MNFIVPLSLQHLSLVKTRGGGRCLVSDVPVSHLSLIQSLGNWMRKEQTHSGRGTVLRFASTDVCEEFPARHSQPPKPGGSVLCVKDAQLFKIKGLTVLRWVLLVCVTPPKEQSPVQLAFLHLYPVRPEGRRCIRKRGVMNRIITVFRWPGCDG